MFNRLITERQEEIFRLVHQDFEGLSTKDAAKKLGITVSTIQHTLKVVEKKIPMMFPILTKRQKEMYDLLDDGLTYIEVAELTNTTEGNVGAFVTKLHKKGYHLNRRVSTIRYQSYMDGDIREVF